MDEMRPEADLGLGEIVDSESLLREPTGRRRKLWMLDPTWHCSIIGTCLDEADLAEVARRLRLSMRADAAPYEVHGFFVQASRRDDALGRMLHKRLDQVHAGALRRAAAVPDADAWRRHWCESIASGRVAGAYWALMSDARVPEPLKIAAFGEVHMLSHLAGRASRDGLRRVAEAQAQGEMLAESIARLRAKASEALAGRDRRIAELEAALSASRQGLPGAAHGNRDASRDRRRLLRAEDRIAGLERRLRAERARARAAEEQAELLRATALLPRSVPPPRGPQVDEPEAICPVLGGRCVLYVGGLNGRAADMRACVESCGGRFLYHDGGVEHSLARLPSLVSQADVVFCPVTCVSHRACDQVKDLCRRAGRRFLPLRSHSLSALHAALGLAAPSSGVADPTVSRSP